MSNKDYNVDSFVVDIAFRDRVTKALSALEKRTLATANKLESALNKAFKVNPSFGNVLNSAKTAAAGVNQAFSHINYAGNGKMQIRSLELQGIQAAHKIGEALKRATVNNPLPKPPIPPANPPAPKGGRNSKGLNPAVKDVEKVSAAVTALESKVSAASQRMEQLLNRAFHINPKFGNLVTQVNNTANAVKTAFSHGFNIANPAVAEIKRVETAGVAAARRIGVEMRKAYKISGSYNPPVPPRPAPRGGNAQPPANRIKSIANSGYYSGLTRRLENMGAGGLAQARKLRQSIYSASQDAKVSGDVERFRLQVKRLNQIAQNWADSQRRSTQHADEVNAGLGKLAMSAGALYAAWNVAKKALDVGVKRDSQVAGADAVYGEKDSKRMQQWSYEFADKLGMKYTDVLKGVTSFASGAKKDMGVDGSRDFYSSFQTYGRLRGLDSEQMKGISLALTQMASKGKIGQDDLRQQLGEHLPGSEQLFADAISGGDIAKLNEMVHTGKLMTKDVFPKVLVQLQKMNEAAGGLEKASQMAVSGIGRVSNSLDNNLASAFKGSEKGVGSFSASLANLLSDSTDISNAIGSGFGSMLSVAAKWLDYADYVANQTDAMVLRVKAWYSDLDDGQRKLVDGASKFGAEVATTVTVITALTAAVKTLQVTAALMGAAGGAGAAGGGGLLRKAGKWASKIPIIGGAVEIGMAAGDWYAPASEEYGKKHYGDETTAGGNIRKNSWMGKAWDGYVAPVGEWLQGNNALKDGSKGNSLFNPDQNKAVNVPSSDSLTKAQGFIDSLLQAAPPAQGQQFDKSSLFSPTVQPRIQVAAPQITAQQDILVRVNMDGVVRDFRGDVISDQFENVNINTEHLED